ncbi:hypothetical protein CTheo_7126 [Ceratobasidium theobromae]|uniref:Uncharacterized protein n=1 Tax=Ceratobasidium theobromae TaxID=1582974 RepID=A0A5N5QCG7_9AGAM|nr:hypothetical protein CTheo_7126 [Ceratobasidium theobromae]
MIHLPRDQVDACKSEGRSTGQQKRTGDKYEIVIWAQRANSTVTSSADHGISKLPPEPPALSAQHRGRHTTMAASAHDIDRLVKDFLSYPFHDDKPFLEGLQLLLGQPVVETFQRGGPLTPELEQSLLGPKVFYYNRQHNTNLTPDLVQEYTRTTPAVPQSPPKSPSATLTGTPDEDRQLSLAELTRLIETGQTHLIPHNHKIPDGIQTEAPEPSKAPIRKKPWERTSPDEQTLENL